jgi:hypothetical protein
MDIEREIVVGRVTMCCDRLVQEYRQTDRQKVRHIQNEQQRVRHKNNMELEGTERLGKTRQDCIRKQ